MIDTNALILFEQERLWLKTIKKIIKQKIKKNSCNWQFVKKKFFLGRYFCYRAGKQKQTIFL